MKKSLTEKTPIKQPKMGKPKITDPLKTLLKTLKAERENGPPIRSAVTAQLHTIQLELEKVQQESTRLKAHAKRRKTEIDEWKAWYAALLEDKKKEGWPKLKAEIDWRAGDIAASEKVISELELQAISIGSKAQQLKHQLVAIEHGIYNRPVEEDPRYLAFKKHLESGPEDALPNIPS